MRQKSCWWQKTKLFTCTPGQIIVLKICRDWTVESYLTRFQPPVAVVTFSPNLKYPLQSGR